MNGTIQLSIERVRMSLKIATKMIASRGEISARRTARQGMT